MVSMFPNIIFVLTVNMKDFTTGGEAMHIRIYVRITIMACSQTCRINMALLIPDESTIRIPPQEYKTIYYFEGHCFHQLFRFVLRGVIYWCDI